MLVATRTDALKDTLRESFREDALGGYWYPVEPGTPLVRVSVGGGSYFIERRRNAKSPWLPIVTADVAEFSVSAFRTWRERYALVAS